MSKPDSDHHAATIAKEIQKYESNIEIRSKRVAKYELRSWELPEVTALMERLTPRPNIAGSDEPCGPLFNRHDGRFTYAIMLGVWSTCVAGCVLYFPFQLIGSLWLLVRGRLRPIWEILPRPTAMLLKMPNKVMAHLSYVKAPWPLVEKSIGERAALCVNRNGKFRVLKEGYAVLSHVWGETMGWQTPDSWGAVDIEVRRQGIGYSHFLRFFERCDAEWLWVDVLAMPEVLEDMPDAEKEKTESLRTSVINCFRQILLGADRVICLDSLLMRTRTSSMIDVAVMLSLSRWINRLWTFTEAKLAKCVKIKTQDSMFDLDEILAYLYDTVFTDEHRYFPLLARFQPLRSTPPGHRDLISNHINPETQEPTLWNDIFCGGENRYSDVEVDAARALFPLLDLQWTSGWTLQQGLEHIAEKYPKDVEMLDRYCKYRSIDFKVSN